MSSDLPQGQVSMELHQVPGAEVIGRGNQHYHVIRNETGLRHRKPAVDLFTFHPPTVGMWVGTKKNYISVE